MHPFHRYHPPHRPAFTPSPCRNGRMLLLLLACCLITPRAWAQATSFTVTVAAKSVEHPFFGRGWDEGFVINGVQGRELTLTRGTTYTFQMSSVPSMHPFYLTTSEAGAGTAPYTAGVQGSGATGNQTLTFTPDQDTPDLLYYNCQSHQFMGGRLVIQDDTGTDAEDEEDLPAGITLEQNYPNPFNPSTTIRFELAQPSAVALVVYDLEGREVRRLVEGVRPQGSHIVVWDGRDGAGRPVASGSYLYRLEAEGTVRERVMTLLK